MYWIVEPHADDAFMALHGHIVGPWKDFPKTIITVCSDELREVEAYSYAKSVFCHHISLGLEDGFWTKPETNRIPLVENWCLPSVDSSDQWIFPLGLRHPDHIQVSERAPVGAWFYLDPYYVQGETNEELNTKLLGLLTVSALWSPESKRHYLSRFPSQAIRFMLSQPYYPPRFELVLRKS